MKEQPRTWITHFRKSDFKRKMKRLQILCTKTFTSMKKFYVHEIDFCNFSKNLLTRKREENM